MREGNEKITKAATVQLAFPGQALKGIVLLWWKGHCNIFTKVPVID